MRIAVAADDAGASIRKDIAEVSRNAGHEVIVLGAELNRPDDDYPVFARLIGDAIASGRAERAFLICGSGAGVTVAANKLPLVRACVAHDTYTAHQMVEHDCCNVMTLGARAVGVEVAKELVRTFVDATFSGADRHRRRLGEAIQLEREQHPDPLQALHDAGQSIWLDNIRRAMLEAGTLARYISGLWVTGLTSNPPTSTPCSGSAWRCATGTAWPRRWGLARAICTRPASCTRRAERGISPDRRGRSDRRGDPGEVVQLLAAEAGAGSRRLSGAQGQGAPGGAGRARRSREGRTVRTADPSAQVSIAGSKQVGSHAARDDRPRPVGRQHGAASDARPPRVRGVRCQP